MTKGRQHSLYTERKAIFELSSTEQVKDRLLFLGAALVRSIREAQFNTAQSSLLHVLL